MNLKLLVLSALMSLQPALAMQSAEALSAQEKLDASLCNAIRAGKLDQAEQLLAAGAHANAIWESKCPALHLAINFERIQLCTLLLTHGADANTKNKYGIPGLWLAATSIEGTGSNEAIYNLLIESGAKRCQAPEGIYIMIQNAIACGIKNSCKLIIDCGVDINRQDDKGNTLLMLAARNGHLTECELLLAAGANPHIPNNKRLKPLKVATRKRHAEVCTLIQAAICNDKKLCDARLAEKPNPSLEENPNECGVCYEDTDWQAPCCGQQVCRDCFYTPVRTGDYVIQGQAFSNIQRAACPFCRADRQ